MLSYSQSSHYDSLYQKGLISKEDYQLLTKPNYNDKLGHIDSLYRSHQINDADYEKLKEAAHTKQALQIKYDPITNTKKAKNQNEWGIALSVGGTILTGVGIGLTYSPVGGAGYVISAVGGITWGSGIICLIHAAVLRHRALKYEKTGF